MELVVVRPKCDVPLIVTHTHTHTHSCPLQLHNPVLQAKEANACATKVKAHGKRKAVWEDVMQQMQTRGGSMTLSGQQFDRETPQMSEAEQVRSAMQASLASAPAPATTVRLGALARN
jgi:hypothetical protein